ncbi:class I SAM-dependent methyltransferase [Mucilaginibacter sp. AW1-7]|uniref:class I SAM-dependent methyltransferase n=1 Tax=Mucilaginibacter sp. AW1-7 TaxID=3349874 RepID=UPI003F7339C2
MKINYIHTEAIHNPAAAAEVLPYLFQLLKPHSVADIGCGTGSWLKVARDLGAKKIRGIDGIHVDRDMLCIPEDAFVQHNLTFPIQADMKYDLAICLEVAEHLPEKNADQIVSVLTDFSDIILFSAGIPGQGGQFHINEQWPAYWQAKFKDHDFLAVDNLRPVFWNNPRVDWWYRQNMLLYVKKDLIPQLGFQATAAVPAYVHPELLHLKLDMQRESQGHIAYLEGIIDKELNHPRVIPALRRLIKSIIR